jgi:hypothetical protein
MEGWRHYTGANLGLYPRGWRLYGGVWEATHRLYGGVWEAIPRLYGGVGGYTLTSLFTTILQHFTPLLFFLYIYTFSFLFLWIKKKQMKIN